MALWSLFLLVKLIDWITKKVKGVRSPLDRFGRHWFFHKIEGISLDLSRISLGFLQQGAKAPGMGNRYPGTAPNDISGSQGSFLLFSPVLLQFWLITFWLSFVWCSAMPLVVTSARPFSQDESEGRPVPCIKTYKFEGKRFSFNQLELLLQASEGRRQLEVDSVLSSQVHQVGWNPQDYYNPCYLTQRHHYNQVLR